MRSNNLYCCDQGKGWGIRAWWNTKIYKNDDPHLIHWKLRTTDFKDQNGCILKCHSGCRKNISILILYPWNWFKIMQYLYLFTMKHKNNSNIGKKTATNKVTHLQKENKTVQETKTKRCIKFLEQKLKNQYFKSFKIC